MSETFGFAAEIVRRSAAGYAGNAASLLLEKDAALGSQAGALDVWKSHLTQRLLELSAALGAGQPRLFSERVIWSRKTFAARNQDDRLIRDSLACLNDVLSESLPPQAAEPTLRYLSVALEELTNPVPHPDPSMLSPDDPTDRLTLRYLQDVLEGNSAVAIKSVVQAVHDGLSVESAYIDVLLGAQKEIGRLWHADEVSVAEEHLVTTTTQKTMAVLCYLSDHKPSNGATAVTACVAGNAHDVGPRALADLYELAGWRSIFLGGDVPASDLPAMLDAYKANVLSLTGSLATHVDHAAESIRLVRKHCERPVKILVGGALFDESPDVAKSIGADAYTADLRAALTMSEQYLSAQ